LPASSITVSGTANSWRNANDAPDQSVARLSSALTCEGCRRGPSTARRQYRAPARSRPGLGRAVPRSRDQPKLSRTAAAHSASGARTSGWLQTLRGTGFAAPETDRRNGPERQARSRRDGTIAVRDNGKWPQKRPSRLRALTSRFLRTGWWRMQSGETRLRRRFPC